MHAVNYFRTHMRAFNYCHLTKRIVLMDAANNDIIFQNAFAHLFLILTNCKMKFSATMLKRELIAHSTMRNHIGVIIDKQ